MQCAFARCDASQGNSCDKSIHIVRKPDFRKAAFRKLEKRLELL
jgi:hypothetical protein